MPITTFTLTGAGAQSNAPFAFGHPFKKGDVPVGSVALGNTADWQCSPLTYWLNADGSNHSVRHAIIAGRANVTAGDTTVTLAAGADPGGTALTEAALGTPNVVVGISGFSDVTLASCIGTSALHRTHCSGPAMSNFIYRKAVAGHNHLVVWFDVRVYKGGNIEVFPWLENGYLLVASPTNWTGTVTVSVNGSQVYNQTVDVKHHTRLPMVNGSTFSYWTGTDPQITPKHDRAYLMATKMVPNYGWLSPTDARLTGLQQTYSPNTLAGVSTNMGDAGGSGNIIPSSQALYVTSGGDVRAYKAAIVFGLSSGSWSVHYRDNVTNEPLKFSSYLTASINIQDTPAIPTGTGGTNGTEAVTHLPSFGYLPYLITARWWFWEECAFWATKNYIQATAGQRLNGKAIIDTTNGTYANRGASWALRTLAETLVMCPSGHSTYAEWKAAWENNMAYYRAKFVDGTSYNGTSFGSGWVSPQGFLGEYSSLGTSLYPDPGSEGVWMGAGYMAAYQIEVMGHTSNLGLPQSSQSQLDHVAVRDQAYKQVVARAGDGTEYNWRRFIVYSYPLGTDDNGLPPDVWCSPTQSYNALRSIFSLAAIPATAGLTLKSHSSDTDLAAGQSSANDYGPNQVSALALAAEHSAPGASAGWARVSGASNFSAFDSYLNDNPAHGFAPRAVVAATVFADVYMVGSGQSIYAGRRRPVEPPPDPSIPAWRSSMAQWEWKQLSGTSALSGAQPTSSTGLGALKGRLDAWNGLAEKDGAVYLSGGGGHSDYYGNESYKIDLTASSPAWAILNQPTPGAQVLLNVDYYADGKPPASHLYYALHEVNGELVRVYSGSLPGDGQHVSNKVHAFILASNTWKAAGSYPDAPATSFARAICKDPRDGTIYFTGDNALFKRHPTTGAWTQLAALPDNGSAFYYGASAVDTTRNRVVFFYDAYHPAAGGQVYDITSNTFSRITFTGAPASDTLVIGQSGCAAHYNATLDRFLLKSKVSGNVYLIHPTTWAITAATTTGGASIVNAVADTREQVFGLFIPVPSLGGFFYQPTHASDAWFLATE